MLAFYIHGSRLLARITQPQSILHHISADAAEVMPAVTGITCHHPATCLSVTDAVANKWKLVELPHAYALCQMWPDVFWYVLVR